MQKLSLTLGLFSRWRRGGSSSRKCGDCSQTEVRSG